MAMYFALLTFVSLLSLVSGEVHSLTASRGDPPVCVIDGQEVQPGYRGPEGNFVKECQLDADGITTKTVACLGGDVFYRDGASGTDSYPRQEYSIGGTWIEGNSPYKFGMQCVTVNGKVHRIMTKCVYDSGEGQVEIEPGQTKEVDGKEYGCHRTSAFGLQYV